MKPIVAIVGRPNVGKSLLFNKLVGERISIVEDTPGVTRDRIYADCEWLNYKFTLIDTGGIEPKTDDIILSQMKRQAEIAIETADVIIFVTDIKTGMTAADNDVCAMLRKSSKPIVLVCNKVDNPGQMPMELYEFYNLGIGDPYPVSAINGLGLGDMLDEVVKFFPEESNIADDDKIIRIAVAGRPNAGKSSLVNKILGDNRVIVSDIPGTTRDAIDVSFEKDGRNYIFTDTAGLRKRGKIEENIEHYSAVRTLLAIDRSDVVLILLDPVEGVTEQDTKIAGYAHDQGKAIVVLVNKWDLVEKETNTMKNFRDNVKEGFGFMLYAPVDFISAKTGARIDKIFELVELVHAQNNMRVPTGVLNDVLNDAILRVQPPTDKGKRLKIFYMTQVAVQPPTFVVFVNDKELAHFSYIRYLENQVREAFGLNATPLKFIVREKNEKK
ncbi:MAG: ribosome biogenesis GTPase Der [Clostridia bacterium]|nr:ribosome biogenesis GTPase Der [Clostridia bacterium]